MGRRIVAEILTCSKQFVIVVVDTWSQALPSMYMASKILNLGMALLLSEAVVMWRTRMVQYFAFKLRMTPWYIGWVMKVVYFVRKITLIAFRFSISECVGQLSMIITIFYPSWWNLLSNSYNHSSNSSPLIQLFAYAWYRHGKCLMPEKYLSFLDLPIRNCSYSTQLYFTMFSSWTFIHQGCYKQTQIPYQLKSVGFLHNIFDCDFISKI